MRERQAFIEATDALVVAQRKNKDDASHAYFAVYDHCKSCHNHFKEK